MILVRGELWEDGRLEEVLSSLEEHLAAQALEPWPEPEMVLAALGRLSRRLEAGEFDGLLEQYALEPSALEEARELLHGGFLEEKVRRELSGAQGGSRAFGHTLRLPLGVLLHLAAGNVPGLAAFTGIEGLLAGNVNLIKLPHGEKGLSLALLTLLSQEEPGLAPYLYAFPLDSRKGDHLAALERLCALSDGMVVWGSDRAVEAARRMAPPGCKLIEWGHRLSFAYVASWREAGEELDALARHIMETGGLLCSSCQVIYLDTRSREEGEAFCRAFLPRLEAWGRRLYPGPGEAAQGTLYAWTHQLQVLIDGGGEVFRGAGCSLTLEEDPDLALSPLHGSALVKLLPREELVPTLRRARGRLQTAGLICPPEERNALTALLARAGVNRVTRGGHMSRTFPGEAHDGEYPLLRYQRLVDVED